MEITQEMLEELPPETLIAFVECNPAKLKVKLQEELMIRANKMEDLTPGEIEELKEKFNLSKKDPSQIKTPRSHAHKNKKKRTYHLPGESDKGKEPEK